MYRLDEGRARRDGGAPATIAASRIGATDGRRPHPADLARLPAGRARCAQPDGPSRLRQGWHRRSLGGSGPRRGQARHRSAPVSPAIVVRDVVVVGAALQAGTAPPSKKNVPGYIRGYDVRTGKRLWTFHTIPQPGEFGNETWEKRFLEVHRQHRRLGAAERRRRTRLRLRPGGDADRRFLRRPPARQQPVRRKPGLPGRAHREARLALPAGASRHVGLGSAHRADPARYHRRRQAHQGRRADHQAGLGLRLRPRDRQAGVADRGAARAAIGRAGREDLADAAVSRPSPRAFDRQGVTPRRPDRLHARAEGRGAEDRVAVPLWVRCSRRPPWRTRTGSWRPSRCLRPPAAPTGRAGRRIRRRACSTLPRSPSRRRFRWRAIRSAPIWITWAVQFNSAAELGPQGLPLVKPPWGRITAIDLNTGEHVWMVPNGSTPEFVKQASGAPRASISAIRATPSTAPILVTKTLLFTADGGGMYAMPPERAARCSARWTRRTGNVLHEMKLPANVTGVPMTYMLDGRAVPGHGDRCAGRPRGDDRHDGAVGGYSSSHSPLTQWARQRCTMPRRAAAVSPAGAFENPEH